MRKNRLTAPLAVLMAVVLTACGGGGDSGGAFQNASVTNSSQAAAKAAAIQATTSAASLPSDGSGSVDIKVYVRDASNVLLPNAPVAFAATSGGLSAAQATTDSNGVATVTLTTAGDTAARSITVTATIGTLKSTVNVSVITSVSKVTLTSDSTALAGDGSAQTTLRAQVLNMNNQAAVGATVSFTATAGGIVLVTQGVTDSSGVATAKITSDKNNVKASVDATASSGGVASNTLTLKVVNTVALTRSPVSLPSDGSLTSTLTATVKDVAGNAVVGLPVSFDGGTGVVTVTQGVTDTNGVATAVLAVGKDNSDRMITATATAGGLVGKTTVTVAAQVSAVAVSSSVATIPTDGSSGATITATVRNANNQYVAGVPVSFTASSGGIAVTQAVTDSNGVATATLSTGNDPTPRTISVTAIAAGIQSSPVSVQVSGVGPNTVASVIVGASQTALPTDGSQTATITATVRNAANVGIAGVPVSFGASSGTLGVAKAVTDANGVVTATLSIGTDHSVRTITVNATAGGVTGSTSVSVGGLYVVTATTSAPSILSDGSTPAEIRAYVRDANNQFVQGVTVTFTASSGGLAVTQAVTDTSGTAIAKLSPASDPTNRTITVTASASGISAQVSVAVIGTTLTIQGPSKLTTGQVGNYSALLVDAGNHPIIGKTLSVTSANGNTLSAASATTDATGRINFTMTATQATTPDTLSVTGLGLTATQSVAIDPDSFAFTTPAAGAQIDLGATQTVKLRWTTGGLAATPVVGSTVQFTTTRGTITASAVTDVNGDATAFLSSATAAGGALVTATAAGGKTAQLSVEFVASTPSTIVLQPDSFSIGPTQSTNVTAVVRDANGNLVKNKVVQFTLNDLSGGSLSTGAATTDSTGRATTVYTAGSLTNPSVTVTGTVQGTAVTGNTTLAVGKQALFIALGTGNSIDEPNVAQYHIRYQVQVTDANGNGVANAALSAKVLSIKYNKGYRIVSGSKWTTTITATCNDEDVNRNGVLDTGEDINANGRLDAGNVVTVTPTNATTDSSGFASLDVYYPQEYAYYLNVDLSVSTALQGTEYKRTSNFTVSGTATDFSDPNTAPPGMVSPFGQAALCTNPN